MSDDIITVKYYRDFAIDRGNGTEYVRWKAWRPSRLGAAGYGKTEEEAKNDLASFCPAVAPDPPHDEGGK